MILIRSVYDACIWFFSVTIYNVYDCLKPSVFKSVFHSWLSILLFLSCSFLSAQDVQNPFNEFSVVKLRINGDYVCYILQCFWTYWVPWWLSALSRIDWNVMDGLDFVGVWEPKCSQLSIQLFSVRTVDVDIAHKGQRRCRPTGGTKCFLSTQQWET